MLRKNTFEAKYPMFVDLIADDKIRKNMLNNEDLMDKCSTMSSSITILIHELRSYYGNDNDTIMDIISNTIFKYPTEILKEFITAYLNSDVSVKCNPKAYVYFNKVLHYGTECIQYVAKNGIIVNPKQYKNLPNEVVKARFDYLAKDAKYGKENLIDYSNKLSISDKEYVNYLLEAEVWHIINDCFCNVSIELELVVSIFNKLNINNIFLSDELRASFGLEYYYAILYYIILCNNKTITENLRELIVMDRYNDIKFLITSSNVELLELVDPDLINSMSLDDILNIRKKQGVNLIKEDN